MNGDHGLDALRARFVEPLDVNGPDAPPTLEGLTEQRRVVNQPLERSPAGALLGRFGEETAGYQGIEDRIVRVFKNYASSVLVDEA